MSPRTHIDLATGSVPGHLVRLSFPMIWGILSIVSMQVADVYFISGLGQVQLEAVSFTIPIGTVLFNLVMGLSIATSSICARLIGAGKIDDLKQFLAHGIFIALMMGFILGAVGEIAVGPIFTLLGAGPDHMPFILSFMRVSLWGYLCISVPFVVNATLRASGDTRTPSLIMAVAAVVNIPLSWVLVYGHMGFPNLGMTGAAVANVASYAMTGLITLYILIMRRGLLDKKHITLTGFSSSIVRMMSIAIPAGLMNLAHPLTATFITALLATSGGAAVAAYGIIGRIEGAAAVILMAVAIAIGPLVGQNYGAQRMNRVKETISVGLTFCVLWAIGMGFLLMALAGPIAQIFTMDQNTIDIIRQYMMITGISTGLANITLGWGSAWNAMGFPRYSLILVVGRFGLGVVLCGGLGHAIGGWLGLFIGMMVGNVIMGLVLHFWSLSRLRALDHTSARPL